MTFAVVRLATLCFVLATFAQGLYHSADSHRDTSASDRAAIQASETFLVPRESRFDRFQASHSPDKHRDASVSDQSEIQESRTDYVPRESRVDRFQASHSPDKHRDASVSDQSEIQESRTDYVPRESRVDRFQASHSPDKHRDASASEQLTMHGSKTLSNYAPRQSRTDHSQADAQGEQQIEDPASRHRNYQPTNTARAHRSRNPSSSRDSENSSLKEQSGDPTPSRQSGDPSHTRQSENPPHSRQSKDPSHTRHSGDPSLTRQSGGLPHTRQSEEQLYNRQSGNPSYSRQVGDPSYSRQSGDPSYSKQSVDPSYSRQSLDPSYSRPLGNPPRNQPQQNPYLNIRSQQNSLNEDFLEFAFHPDEYSYQADADHDPHTNYIHPTFYSQKSHVIQETCSCNCDNYGTVQQEATEPSCEWRMVFKAVQGSQRSVHDDWFDVGGINDDTEAAKELLSNLPYRDGDILDDWNFLYIKRVKIEIFSQGVLGARFYFDATASDLESWFSPERLISAPVQELKSRDLNHFFIEGDASRGRRFLIDTGNPYCSDACGYLIVIDPSNYKECDWEYYDDYPYFMWSAGESCKRWSVKDTDVIGDRFVISVKICDREL